MNMNTKFKRHLLQVSLLVAGISLTPLVSNSTLHPIADIAAKADTNVTDSTKLSEVMPNFKLRNLVWYNYNDQLDQEGKTDIGSVADLTVGDLAQLRTLQWWPENFYKDPTYMQSEPLDGGNGAIGPANKGSYSLEGLQYAKNLTHLDIAQNFNYGKKYWNNDITDISPLAKLTNLTYVDLHGNRITDITPISKLLSIDSLDISYNGIADLSSLNAAQYTKKFNYGRQYIVLPKVNLNGDSYTWKNPFIGKLPQGVAYNDSYVSMYSKGFTPALDLNEKIRQWFAFSGNVAPDNEGNYDFTNLAKQVSPGPANITYNGQPVKSVQNPYKYYMNLVYQSPTNQTFIEFLPYQDNVASVDYQLVPYDKDTNQLISNYKVVTASGTPGDEVPVPTIDGYTPVESQVEIPAGGGTIKAYYTKNPVTKSTITTEYQDEDGNRIQSSKVDTGSVGDSYTPNHPQTITKNGISYSYSGVKGNRDLPTKFTKDNQVIVYIYKKVTNPVNPVSPVNPVNPGGSGSSSSTVVPGSSSSSSNSSASSSTEVEPELPAYAAKKNMAVYSLKPIYLYQKANFNKRQRLVHYVKKPRVFRPMFVVTGYARSSTGNLRYEVRDVNRLSKTAGKRGYITAQWGYVRPVYYRSQHRTLTVINPRGVNEYKKRNLTSKVRNFKQGKVLHVKRFVTHNLTTRYRLSNGHYITGNRKLVKMGRVKQPKRVTVKRTIHRYRTTNLTKRNGTFKKGTKIDINRYTFSHATSMSQSGTKRYAVKGGYITANSRYVKVQY